MDTTLLHVVKVFVGASAKGGNPLGVFLDGGGFSPARRQEIAADLGYSETVFVTDRNQAALHIHTPTVELPLAGHPLVGTAWLLAEQVGPVSVLRPPAGAVTTWRRGGVMWIRADPDAAPSFELLQLASPADVDTHPGAGPDEYLQVWAWGDEAQGRVRVRVFPTAAGITEDEATGGSGASLGAAARALAAYQAGCRIAD